MENLTIMLYTGAGTLTLLVSFFMFGSFLTTKKSIVARMSAVFFFIGAHSFSFVLPLIFAPENTGLVGFGFILGVVCIFLVLLTGLEIERFMTHGILTKRRVTLIGIFIVLLAVSTIALMIVYPTNPIFLESGVILWNLTLPAGWIIGLVSLVYGIIWGSVFYKGAFLVPNMQSRFKLLVISADGYLLGTATFLAFTASTAAYALSSHIIFIITGVLTLSIYLIPKRFFTTAEGA